MLDRFASEQMIGLTSEWVIDMPRNIQRTEHLPNDALESIHKVGQELLFKYEPPDKHGGGRISEYLAHCTTTRIVPREWRIHEMYNEIEDSLTQLERHIKPSPEFGVF